VTDPGLADFVAAAGAGLGAAQTDLVGPLGEVPTSMALSEAELEVKATLSTGADGKVGLQPISAAQIAKGTLPVGLVSTVRVRYVPVALDTPVGAPGKQPVAVVSEVRGRDDVKRLEKIFGELRYDATFVPGRASWLVEARDLGGRSVRQLLVADGG